jgi:predicted porin
MKKLSDGESATVRPLSSRNSAWRWQSLCRGAAAGSAALLFQGAACAQSSVTLYGTLDTSIEITNPGNGYVARMDSGAYRGSRVGLAGKEEIAQGTFIVFDLESGFSSADGTLSTSGSLFNRQAWIGVQNDYGTVRVGRQYSPIYIPFKGQLDAFGAGTIASGLNNLSKITPYESNAITYLSPQFYGFSATLQAAMRDPASDGNGLAGTIETVSWQHGGLRLSYAHQQMHGSDGLRANLGGASYHFDRMTVYTSYFDGKQPGYDNRGVAVSTKFYITRAFTASLGYTYLWDRSGADNNADQFSASCEYALSRKLLLYASAGFLRNHAQADFTLRGVNVTGLTPSAPGAPVRGVQLGFLERF